MEGQKLTKEQLITELSAIIFTLRPFEEVRIKKDKFGKIGKIVVLTEGTTILELME